MNLANLTSRLATKLRFGAACEASANLGPRPEMPLVLYEFEGCPFCRKVREAVTDLDLSVEVRPCPKGGKRFRPDVSARKERPTFPFIIDPNTETEMFESADIVRYLYERYGKGDPPSFLTSASFLISSQAASLIRGTSGTFSRRSAEIPDEPLILDGCEGDPEARLVRERLCELELPYLRRNAATVRLTDPSTQRVVTGSSAALAYLEESWG